MGAHLWLGSHGVFNSQSHTNWSSSNLPITVYIFLPWHLFLWRFLLMDFCFHKLWLSIYLSVSSIFGVMVWTVTSESLTDLRRIVDFSVCSAFYLLLGWSGNFQTAYTLVSKPSISTKFLFIFNLDTQLLHHLLKIFSFTTGLLKSLCWKSNHHTNMGLFLRFLFCSIISLFLCPMLSWYAEL